MTRQQAINAKCRECIYDETEPGNWRQQVHACSIKACSLWPYRPKSKSARIVAAEAPAEAI